MPVVLACSPSAAVPLIVTGAEAVLAVGVSVPLHVVLSPAANVLPLHVIAPPVVVPLTLLTGLVPVLVTGTATVAGWPAATGTAFSGDPALVPLTVGVPMVRWHEHPVSPLAPAGAGAGAGTCVEPLSGHEHPLSRVVPTAVGVVELVVVAPAVLSPVPLADVAAIGMDVADGTAAGKVLALLVAPLRATPPVMAEAAAVTGLDEPDFVVSAELTGARTRATDETGVLADPLPDEVAELLESAPLVVTDPVGVDADAEVVPVDADFCGCTSPDTSDVTESDGLVPAVVTVAWSLGREGSVVSSAWATPTPRSIKPPASNPAWRDRFTQVCMRKPFQGLLG
ncbi:hypothetical protein [Amycolatopsis sp. NPDC003676]